MWFNHTCFPFSIDVKVGEWYNQKESEKTTSIIWEGVTPTLGIYGDNFGVISIGLRQHQRGSMLAS